MSVYWYLAPHCYCIHNANYLLVCHSLKIYFQRSSLSLSLFGFFLLPPSSNSEIYFLICLQKIKPTWLGWQNLHMPRQWISRIRAGVYPYYITFIIQIILPSTYYLVVPSPQMLKKGYHTEKSSYVYYL